MANVLIREGKKGSQIYYDYKTPENPRKRVPSGVYLTGSKAYQRQLIAEAQVRAFELESEAMKSYIAPVRKSVVKAEPPVHEEPTIIEYVTNAQVGQAQSTKKSISGFKNQFIQWLTDNGLQNLHFRQMTIGHAEEYLTHLVGSMKLSSAKTYYAWIKVIFNVAVDDDLIDVNPLNLPQKKYKRIYRNADKKVDAHAFDIEDIRKLIAYEDKLIADSTLLTFLCNGRRLNEIYKLKWSDINWEKRTITFVTSKTGIICQVYIGPKLEKLLQNIRKTHNGMYVLPRQAKTLNGAVHPLTTDVLSRRMRSACVAIGLLEKNQKGYSGYGHHSIRRTVETLLIEHLDFVRADALIGHAPSTLGAKHYYRPTIDVYKDASNYLESLIDY